MVDMTTNFYIASIYTFFIILNNFIWFVFFSCWMFGSYQLGTIIKIEYTYFDWYKTVNVLYIKVLCCFFSLCS